LLLATNYSEWNSKTLLKTTKNAFAKSGKKLTIIAHGAQGEDFPGTGQSKESSMVWLMVSPL